MPGNRGKAGKVEPKKVRICLSRCETVPAPISQFSVPERSQVKPVFQAKDQPPVHVPRSDRDPGFLDSIGYLGLPPS